MGEVQELTGSVRCLFFSSARDATGLAAKDYLLVDLLPSGSSDCVVTTEHLKARLLKDFPELAKVFVSAVFSLNLDYLEPDIVAPLKSGDELAVIPPISGG
jgi:molybdopterin converting factor small subunit